MLQVVSCQELGCVQYRGNDPHLGQTVKRLLREAHLTMPRRFGAAWCVQRITDPRFQRRAWIGYVVCNLVYIWWFDGDGPFDSTPSLVVCAGLSAVGLVLCLGLAMYLIERARGMRP